jgi:3-hydroxymyristoyl/3-hydroxydecanoyl-(acyl carrier protein) dehydratase
VKFRFVDKILSWTPHQRICGLKAVSFEEYCLKEAFGGPPRLPELLMLESLLQLGNWLILLSSDYQQMGMVVKLAEVRFHGHVGPGQQLRLDIRLRSQKDEGFVLTGEGTVDGRPIISGLECLAVAVAAERYVNAENLRMLFSEIYEPEEKLQIPTSNHQ